MSLDSKGAIAKAFYATLFADAGVQARIGNPARIYSIGGVPQTLWPGPDNDFPAYATIGRADGNIGNIQTKDKDGMDGQVWVETWSSHKSALEIVDLQEAIADAVTFTSISAAMPAGHGLVLIYLDFSSTFLDTSWDAAVMHGIQRWRYQTERGS